MFEKILKKKFKNRFLKDKFFSEITTFRIGGKIKFFVEVKKAKEIIFLIKLCKKYKIKYVIIGGGSNILASDEGFSGLVISTLKFCKIKFSRDKVSAQSGARLSALVTQAKNKNLSGLEWAISIPGTVGGAVVMNAGAFGEQMSNFIEGVVFFDGKKVRRLKRQDIFFEYRNSFFKNAKIIVILTVNFRFFHEKIEKIQKNIEKYIGLRLKTQNVGLASAGSIFKRMPNVTAAELIDKAGLKGTKIGGAMVSTVHSGYIVNFDNATNKDVLKLIDFISKSVYNKYNVNLELEIIQIGD